MLSLFWLWYFIDLYTVFPFTRFDLCTCILHLITFEFEATVGLTHFSFHVIVYYTFIFKFACVFSFLHNVHVEQFSLKTFPRMKAAHWACICLFWACSFLSWKFLRILHTWQWPFWCGSELQTVCRHWTLKSLDNKMVNIISAWFLLCFVG